MIGVRDVVRDRLLPQSQTAREQMYVTAGQLASGASNLVFALVAVRILPRTSYAHLVTFLALYMLVHVFAGSVSAGAAVSPAAMQGLRPRLWKIGCVAGLVVIAANEPVAAITGLASGPVIALGLALPAAGVLAVERGILYGTRRFKHLVASLLVEPGVRLTLGLALAAAAGARGAATAVAAAGWLALAVAAPQLIGPRWTSSVSHRLRLDRAVSALEPRADGGPATARSAVVTFFLLAVLMNQDVVWANRLLGDAEAGRFAVLSTLGGIAGFATSTVPLVLLGQRDRADAFRNALRWATYLGIGAIAVVTVAPSLIVTVGFGSQYADVIPLVVPYVIAMATLGIGRVFAARLCVLEQGRTAAICAGGGVALQALLIVAGARTPGAIATATLVSTVGVALALGATLGLRSVERGPRRTAAFVPRVEGAETRPDAPTTQRVAAFGERLQIASASWRRQAEEWWSDRSVRWAAALMGAGLLLRLVALRSVWLDEAIAVQQARLPFGKMIEALRYGDVHPPLHSALLWFTTRVIGTSELAIRLPSMIAGTLLIGVLYAMGRDLYDRRTGVAAAAFATVAPFLVWYSQEARMYALFMLFGVVAVWMQIRILRGGHRLDWAAYAAATALLLWTHYFAVLQVVVQQAVFAFGVWQLVRRRGDWLVFLRRWSAAIAGVILLLLLLVPILRDQLVAYGNRGAGLQDVPQQAGGELDPQQQQLSVYALIANLVWAVWGYHSDDTMAQIVALWPLGLLFILFLLGRRRSMTSLVAVATFVVPMLALFAIGLAKRDLFELRYFVIAAPLLLLLAARVVTTGVQRPRLQIAAVAFIVGTLAVGAVDQQTNGANPRIYDFRGALTQIGAVAEPNDVVMYAPFYLDPVMDYYAPHLRAQKLEDDVPRAPSGGRVIVLASFLEKKEVSGRVGGTLARLREDRTLERELELPRVKVWIFR